jgi:hypothetical protein
MLGGMMSSPVYGVLVVEANGFSSVVYGFDSRMDAAVSAQSIRRWLRAGRTATDDPPRADGLRCVPVANIGLDLRVYVGTRRAVVVVLRGGSPLVPARPIDSTLGATLRRADLSVLS